jgi:purine-binding chemotaxis protein CheW
MRIANAAPSIKGVVNLRGVIVPVMDLRLLFSLDQINYDSTTVVVVLNVGNRAIGMVVDSVSDVITLKSDQLRAAPEFGSGIESDHVLAIGTVDDRMLILLDIAKLMSGALGVLDEPTLQ